MPFTFKLSARRNVFSWARGVPGESNAKVIDGIAFFGRLAAIIVIFPAWDAYQMMANGPWWRRPRPQLLRYLAKQVGLLFAAALAYAIFWQTLPENRITSVQDALHLWLGCLVTVLVLAALAIPGWLLGIAWYGITHRRKLQRRLPATPTPER